MDAWRNARDIEILQKEVEQLKKHIVTITELVLRDRVSQKSVKPVEVPKEEPKETPKKKRWFNRSTAVDKNETVQSKQHKP